MGIVTDSYLLFSIPKSINSQNEWRESALVHIAKELLQCVKQSDRDYKVSDIKINKISVFFKSYKHISELTTSVIACKECENNYKFLLVIMPRVSIWKKLLLLGDSNNDTANQYQEYCKLLESGIVSTIGAKSLQWITSSEAMKLSSNKATTK